MFCMKGLRTNPDLVSREQWAPVSRGSITSHTDHPLAGISVFLSHFAAVKDVWVSAVILVDFSIIQRNVSVGVLLFSAPGWSHRHTFCILILFTLSLSHTFLLFFHCPHSPAVFVLLQFVVLFIYGFCLFCWETPAGSPGRKKGGIPSVWAGL